MTFAQPIPAVVHVLQCLPTWKQTASVLTEIWSHPSNWNLSSATQYTPNHCCRTRKRAPLWTWNPLDGGQQNAEKLLLLAIDRAGGGVGAGLTFKHGHRAAEAGQPRLREEGQQP